MQVAQMMQTSVHTCRSQDTLEHAARLLWDHDIGCLPVLDEGEKPVAMLTDRDICMAAYTQARRLSEMRASSAMSRNLVACRPEDTIAAAEELMQGNKVRRLPVIDASGRLVGLVALNDIARVAARTRGDKRRPVSEAEVGETLASICEPRVSCPVEPMVHQGSSVAAA